MDAAPAPAPAPAAPVADAPPPLPALASLPALPAAVASAPLPGLAEAPPAFPANVGVDIPVSRPAPPPVLSSTPTPASGTAVVIAFTPGSSTLPPSGPLELRRFALAHRGVPLTVTGHGDGVLPGPESQSRALQLALRRSQAIAEALATAGVPASNLHLNAVATGQGGSASL